VRHDIQFLRGFAVLAVLFYHAGVFSISGGYLGVDVFFVISGYLITNIIMRDMDAGTFSFGAFYLRRAKRLLPAAYSTFVVTTLLCYAFLTTSQWDDYLEQLIGAVTFTANIVLPSQTGYFESAAEGKPLLHVWSLSLEEQYYLVTPLLLLLLKPRFRTIVFSVALIASLACCVLFVTLPFSYWRIPSMNSESMAFFLLPARAWELLAGSIIAWLMIRIPSASVHKIYKILALIIASLVVISPFDTVHPRGDAIIVVIATGAMLIGNSNWLPRNIITNLIAKIGDWSYSLYLVHWPLFALAYIGYIGDIPIYIKVLLVIASVALAYLQYEYVEQRFRYGWHENRGRTIKWLVAVSLVVIISPAPAVVINNLKNQQAGNKFDYLHPPYLGLSKNCTEGEAVVDPQSCATSGNPRYAVWGDSFAMHLVPGLKTDREISESFIQITKSACAPIMDIAFIGTYFNENWAKGCIDFNSKAMELIKSSDSIEYVFISSPFYEYFREGELPFLYQGKSIAGNRSLAIEQMIYTIGVIRESGRVPVIISPPPKAGFNIGECWERKQTGLTVLGHSECGFSKKEYEGYQSSVNGALKEIEKHTNVDVVWLDSVMCNEENCTTIIDDISIYRDAGHLTSFGSEWVMRQLKLSERLGRKYSNRKE
jgi:peptidoglycan/LPS O-acetylase OafA/YrhL